MSTNAPPGAAAFEQYTGSEQALPSNNASPQTTYPPLRPTTCAWLPLLSASEARSLIKAPPSLSEQIKAGHKHGNPLVDEKLTEPNKAPIARRISWCLKAEIRIRGAAPPSEKPSARIKT